VLAHLALITAPLACLPGSFQVGLALRLFGDKRFIVPEQLCDAALRRLSGAIPHRFPHT
jgi:hypothetical protein